MQRMIAGALLALMAAACGVLGGDEEETMAVWDLRETHAIEAVGWPEDAGSSFRASSDGGLERILLPGDVVVEGEFQASPSRLGSLGDLTAEDELLDLIVTFPREPIDAVLDRAERHARQLDVDLEDIRRWAVANRDSQDVAPGGATGRTDEVPLEGRATAFLETQASPNGEGLLRLTVFWEPEESDGSEERT